MPGMKFIRKLDGTPPLIAYYPLAKNMNGTGTPPACDLQSGDPVVYSTGAIITTSSAKVVRMVTAADRTAEYKQGTPVAGILGVVHETVAANSAGRVMAQTTTGGSILASPSLAASKPLDANGHSIQGVIVADDSTVFEIALDGGASATPATVGQTAGFVLTTSSGVTTYTASTSETAKPLVIIDYNKSDPTKVHVVVQPAYQQYLTGVTYTTPAS